MNGIATFSFKGNLQKLVKIYTGYIIPTKDVLFEVVIMHLTEQRPKVAGSISSEHLSS